METRNINSRTKLSTVENTLVTVEQAAMVWPNVSAPHQDKHYSIWAAIVIHKLELTLFLVFQSIGEHLNLQHIGPSPSPESVSLIQYLLYVWACGCTVSFIFWTKRWGNISCWRKPSSRHNYPIQSNWCLADHETHYLNTPQASTAHVAHKSHVSI